MIQSMTAFARSQEEGPWGTIICELRSINHRYLEVSMRLPESLHVLEAPVRERIRQYLKRGKVDLFLRYQPNAVSAEITLNMPLIENLCQVNAIIATKITASAPINTMDILRWPGVMQMPEMNSEVVQQEILTQLELTLKKLVAARQREGAQLSELFAQKLALMKVELAKVRERIPTVIKSQRTRLLARCSDANLQFEPERLEQELVLQAQKIDITEEIERLETHILEVQRNLTDDDLVGRRLDFLMQELNREANTLGAKSIDADITRAAVELKVLIEQVREQVQNIE